MAVPNGKMAVLIGSRLNQNDFNILFIFQYIIYNVRPTWYGGMSCSSLSLYSV